jgi:hypothetical protein
VEQWNRKAEIRVQNWSGKCKKDISNEGPKNGILVTRGAGPVVKSTKLESFGLAPFDMLRASRTGF